MEPVLDDASFFSLALPTFERADRSPPLDDAHGLRIACPSRPVPVGELPLCGTIRLPLDEARTYANGVLSNVVVVVVDLERRKPVAVTLDSGKSPVEPARATKPAPGVTVKEYFNVDLRMFASTAAVAPGRYVLYATLGPHLSNVVECEVGGKAEQQ